MLSVWQLENLRVFEYPRLAKLGITSYFNFVEKYILILHLLNHINYICDVKLCKII